MSELLRKLPFAKQEPCVPTTRPGAGKLPHGSMADLPFVASRRSAMGMALKRSGGRCFNADGSREGPQCSCKFFSPSSLRSYPRAKL